MSVNPKNIDFCEIVQMTHIKNNKSKYLLGPFPDPFAKHIKIEIMIKITPYQLFRIFCLPVANEPAEAELFLKNAKVKKTN